MNFYKNYRLVEDSQGFTLEINLNHDEEFSAEFLAKIKENALSLEDNVKKLISEKFPDIKINAVKFMVGSMVVGSMALGGLSPLPNMTAYAATPQASTTQVAIERTATVTASKLNMRSGPSTTYSIMHVLWQGNIVKIIGESDGWYQIELTDGRVGWSSSQYLSLNNQATTRQATVTASRLNMRSGPSTNYSIMHVLWQGNIVKIIGESDGWYQIKLTDGRVGWSSSQYLSLNNQATTRQAKVDAVINQAKSLLGTPYVYGGDSPGDGGFDCSGFTKYVYGQSGYNLNRISKDQALNGTYVARGYTQPGDLVFYSFAGNGLIDHVGIYLGEGKMINSPKTGDVVKITDVNTSYWTSRYVTTRRIIP